MSMKKSIFVVFAVILAVTLFQFSTSGSNAMLISMDDDSISFSGIGDFNTELVYSEIVALELLEDGDYDVLGCEKVGQFRVGSLAIPDGHAYTVFVTTTTAQRIVATLTDGSHMIFNYNNTSDTVALYEMLLANLE